MPGTIPSDTGKNWECLHVNGIMHKTNDTEYDHMIIPYSSFARLPQHDHYDEACPFSSLIVLEYFSLHRWSLFSHMTKPHSFHRVIVLLFTCVFQDSVFRIGLRIQRSPF